jgi:hypothetical protein
MTNEEKNKLLHDVTNSFVIINSISKSASNFVDKFFDNNCNITETQIDLFKKAMLSLQKEMSKIEDIFHERLNQL